MLFQFTPLREGRLVLQPPCALVVDISIHAPPRGATLTPCSQKCTRRNFNSRPSARGDAPPAPPAAVYHQISIHAPPRGATRQKHAGWYAAPISIHAPPRGATSRAKRKPRPPNFNSRPSARGDVRRTSSPSRNALFQFTPLREGRLHDFFGCRVLVYFNSRPSARGDEGLLPHRTDGEDFNSRPSARGDVVKVPICRTAEISIHAPPRGATSGANS